LGLLKTPTAADSTNSYLATGVYISAFFWRVFYCSFIMSQTHLRMNILELKKTHKIIKNIKNRNQKDIKYKQKKIQYKTNIIDNCNFIG
jgi:hypothetical protein